MNVVRHAGPFFATILLLVGWTSPLEAQNAEGPIIMRSQGTIQWWAVDPRTGQAAFYGGDIVAICNEEPGGHDLVDLQVVHPPADLAQSVTARGEDVGASLWDHAPPFNPNLCADILSREGPLAVGTADLTWSGRIAVDWGNPDVTTPYGMAAHGTMRTPEGETLRVNSHFRCVYTGGNTKCTQGVQVR